jgi:hypothetical protein
MTKHKLKNQYRIYLSLRKVRKASLLNTLELIMEKTLPDIEWWKSPII